MLCDDDDSWAGVDGYWMGWDRTRKNERIRTYRLTYKIDKIDKIRYTISTCVSYGPRDSRHEQLLTLFRPRQPLRPSTSEIRQTHHQW